MNAANCSQLSISKHWEQRLIPLPLMLDVAMAQTGCYPEKAPKMNQLLTTLSHNLRREVIHYFENIESTNTVTVEDLATHVARRVPRMNQRQISLELTHKHLPKLESNGWIEYDTRTHCVRYRGHASAEELLAELATMLSDQPYPSYPD